MTEGRRIRGWFARGVTFALVCVLAPSAYAQRVLNEPLTTDNAGQPIQLFADHAATWNENGREIYLLKGGVVVSQGNTAIRAPEVAVFVDRSRLETERMTYVLVYGDGSIGLERGPRAAKADFGYVRLATSGSVDLKVYKSNLVRAEQTGDRTFMRALANQPEGLSLVKRNDPVVVPNAPRADAMLRQAGGVQAAPLPPPPLAVPNPMDALQQAPPPRVEEPAVKKVTTTYVQVPQDLKVEPVPDAVPGAPAFPPAAPGAKDPKTPKAQPRLSVRPRYQGDLQVQYKPLEADMTAVIVTGTGGVTLLVTAPSAVPGAKASSLDIEADRVVIWTKGNPQKLFNDMSQSSSDSGAHEIYMAGNVEVRTRTAKEVETLRADEVYYDVRRGVAVARQADLEIRSPKLYRPLHMIAGELIQVNPKLYKANDVNIHNSILPSDPGLVVDVKDATVEERTRERNYLGFIPAYDKEGKRITDTERIFTGRNMFARLEGVPVFYFPYLKDNLDDPLGPLDQLNLSYNYILGFQIYSTWDLYDLFHLPRFEGTRWRLYLDYLTERGPATGTEFEFSGKEIFGTKATYTGVVRLYGIRDTGTDQLGGNRGQVIFWPDFNGRTFIDHPQYRGHAYGSINVQDIPNGFTVLGQFSFLSDRNFLEQFFLNTYQNDLNQNTYLYAKQQQDIWAWSIMGQVGTRGWLTETDWLPKADAAVTGLTIFDDWLVYNAHASAGYARLRPPDVVPYAYSPTDTRTDTARFDLWQELSLPFNLGPVNVAPYLKGDLAYYSRDITGNDRGRLWGGGGVRWNMPLSKLYPDISSEFFNLDGIYHKINLTGNYFTAASSSRFLNFPQLDRLNDDVSDQALRDIRPLQTFINPTNGYFLANSPIINGQYYALRRLIDSNVDTLDQIDVLQLGFNQRWQTRRGFPGNEHVADWMTLNLGVSVFPHSTRDNFGHSFGIAEWDWLWNIGDRTALSSQGWFEPWSEGPRAFQVGFHYNRPDSTTFYLGYGQIDPVKSKAVIANLVYPLSAKYAINASTVWDFGTDVKVYSLFIARMGTDVMFNFGVSYVSAMNLNAFGFALEVLPNVVRRTGRSSAMFPSAMMNIDPMVNTR